MDNGTLHHGYCPICHEHTVDIETGECKNWDCIDSEADILYAMRILQRRELKEQLRLLDEQEGE